MPDLSDISYSREATIAAVRDYYHFLISMYLPSSSIIEPPADGWPNMNRETWPDFDKTDEVFTLLRHLPYLSTRDTKIQSIPEGHFADYTSFSSDWDIEQLTATLEDLDLDDDVEVPPHIVGLTHLTGENTPLFLLDTEFGIIYWPNCHGRIKYTGPEQSNPDGYGMADEDLIPEDQALWRSMGATWAISDFFEMLKFHCREMYFVPVGNGEVRMAWNRDGSDGGMHDSEMSDKMDGIAEIYRECKWPDLERFGKEECHRRVQKMLRERWKEEKMGYPGDYEAEDE
jgi:hypothetical protein